MESLKHFLLIAKKKLKLFSQSKETENQQQTNETQQKIKQNILFWNNKWQTEENTGKKFFLEIEEMHKNWQNPKCIKEKAYGSK